MNLVPDKPIIISHNFQENSLKDKYNVTLDVEWQTPCRVNGDVVFYHLHLIKCDNRNDYKNVIIPISPSIKYNYRFENFLPDSCYNVIVQLLSQSKYNEKWLRVTSPAGSMFTLLFAQYIFNKNNF